MFTWLAWEQVAPYLEGIGLESARWRAGAAYWRRVRLSNWHGVDGRPSQEGLSLAIKSIHLARQMSACGPNRTYKFE